MNKLTERSDAVFMTWKQAQSMLNVSMVKTRQICSDANAIRHFGGRTVRIDRSVLMDFINCECMECAENPACKK